MEKATTCKCKGKCQNNRCACKKSRKPCSEQCKCEDCQNPYNGVKVDELNICTLDNIQYYKKASKEKLQTKVMLSCECEEVEIEKLLSTDGYDCSECGENYYYSICWNDVAQDSTTWHCEVCKTCRYWREWHCDNCNKCTYGVSLDCQHCGASGGYSEMF